MLRTFTVPALLCALAGAQAQEARITQVKVYPGSATVERTLRVPAGARQATFACLPPGLDAQSLQVSADAAVRVGELAVRTQPRELVAACRSPLEERIRTLEDELAALKAEGSGLAAASDYVASFGKPAQGGAQARQAAADIGATVDALRRSGQGVAQRQHQIARQSEALERELKPLRAERDRAFGAGSRVTTVQVTLAAPQAGDVRLVYQVRGPSWQPGYRATLDVQARRVRLARTAQVAQSTGEDWAGVPLVLSTGQPGAATSGPLPRPWRLAQAPEVFAAPAPAAAPALMMARSKAAQAVELEQQEEAPPSFDASVFQGAYATEFALPQRITVPSNGERITLALDEQVLDARLLARTTPTLDASAYLVAEFTLPPGVWPAGPVALYRGGAYVGAGAFDAASVARTGLAFGRDERVTVRTLPAAEMAGAAGLIGARAERRVARAWEVRNGHHDAVTLQLLDAAPVAEHQDIRIASRYQPTPQDTAWNQQPGAVLWEMALPAGAVQRVSAEHTITTPKDMRVQERE